MVGTEDRISEVPNDHVRPRDPGDVPEVSSPSRAAGQRGAGRGVPRRPVFAWIHPEPGDAGDESASCSTAVEALAQPDDTWSAGPGAEGRRAWVTYGQSPMSGEHARGVWGTLGERAGQDAGRLFELVALMEQQRPHEPTRPVVLGVVPGAQGWERRAGMGPAARATAPAILRSDECPARRSTSGTDVALRHPWAPRGCRTRCRSCGTPPAAARASHAVHHRVGVGRAPSSPELAPVQHDWRAR